jgi:hypothetical protein
MTISPPCAKQLEGRFMVLWKVRAREELAENSASMPSVGNNGAKAFHEG